MGDAHTEIRYSQLQSQGWTIKQVENTHGREEFRKEGSIGFAKKDLALFGCDQTVTFVQPQAQDEFQIHLWCDYWGEKSGGYKITKPPKSINLDAQAVWITGDKLELTLAIQSPSKSQTKTQAEPQAPPQQSKAEILPLRPKEAELPSPTPPQSNQQSQSMPQGDMPSTTQAQLKQSKLQEDVAPPPQMQSKPPLKRQEEITPSPPPVQSKSSERLETLQEQPSQGELGRGGSSQMPSTGMSETAPAMSAAPPTMVPPILVVETTEFMMQASPLMSSSKVGEAESTSMSAFSSPTPPPPTPATATEFGLKSSPKSAPVTPDVPNRKMPDTPQVGEPILLESATVVVPAPSSQGAIQEESVPRIVAAMIFSDNRLLIRAILGMLLAVLFALFFRTLRR